MDEHEEFTDLDDEPFDPMHANRRMRPLDFIIAVWCLFGCYVEGTAAFFNHVATILVAHRNYEAGQRDFADSIRADLDNIPTKED